MKYAFMSFSTPQLSLAEMLALAKRLGYDGIEPRIDAGHAHEVGVAASPGRRRELRRQAIDSGVALCCVATSCRVADARTALATIDELRERIDLAGDVGSPRMRIFGGPFADSIRREVAVDSCVDTLTAVADHAKDRGVTLCFETHDAWCDPRHVAAVLEKVNHPNVAANWDIMHPVRTKEATIDESFAALRAWIRHLHVHDGKGERKLTLAPIGEGIIDHRRALELLEMIDYDGYISGEWIKWEPHEAHLPRELATLKRYEQELG